MRATNASSFSGDTFAPTSRLLAEVLVARLSQVHLATTMHIRVALQCRCLRLVAHVSCGAQVLPHVCADVLDAAMPQLMAAALGLSQVLAARIIPRSARSLTFGQGQVFGARTGVAEIISQVQSCDIVK